VDEAEISLRRVMMEQAKRRIFLCDSSKIGVRRPFLLCTKDAVEEIISDVPLSFCEEEGT